MQEIQVPPLDWEDLLEEEMATHSSTGAWEIPWTEQPGRLESMELQRVRYNLATEHTCPFQGSHLTSLSFHLGIGMFKNLPK